MHSLAPCAVGSFAVRGKVKFDYNHLLRTFDSSLAFARDTTR